MALCLAIRPTGPRRVPWDADLQRDERDAPVGDGTGLYTSCDVTPGEGLGACLSEQCANPQLRVEAQSFLVLNEPNALSFADFDHDGDANGLHQAKALPSETGEPVVFLGSTTAPSFTQEKCSPLQVTWSVRPACAKVDIGSLNKWCEGNLSNEDH